MDLEKEKERLIGLLEVPVTAVSFSNFFCEVYYRDTLIGYLPITVSAAGIQYENLQSHARKLDWRKICSLSALELNAAVASRLGRTTFKIVPSSFRRLFIEDGQNNLFASFECRYKNKGWEVIDERILHYDPLPESAYQRETTSSANPKESVIPAPPNPFTT